MKVLVCGDRHWTDYEAILKELAGIPQGNPLIIHGACRGADMMAHRAAGVLRLAVKPYPADWKKYGRAAGPVRNRQMLDTKPDLVLAFHDNLDASRGTKDCVTEARRRGIAVRVLSHTWEPTP